MRGSKKIEDDRLYSSFTQFTDGEPVEIEQNKLITTTRQQHTEEKN